MSMGGRSISCHAESEEHEEKVWRTVPLYDKVNRREPGSRVKLRESSSQGGLRKVLRKKKMVGIKCSGRCEQARRQESQRCLAIIM